LKRPNRPQAGVTEQLEQATCKLAGIIGRRGTKPPPFATSSGSAAIRDDDRQSAGHRLAHGEAESLERRRRDETSAAL
jgi:hypothetical protein